MSNLLQKSGSLPSPRRSALATGGWPVLLVALFLCSSWQSSAAEPGRASEKNGPAGGRPPQLANSLSLKDALVFRNGDLLYGRLQSISPENGVRWQHNDASQPIEFATNNISQIYFRSRPDREVALSNLCRIQLGTEEELEGNLVFCDREKIVLETWYAGRIELPRKLARVIRPVPADRSAIYEGPTGLDGWTLGKVSSAVPDPGEWKYRNGGFYASRSASIARDLGLPDVASIQFDLAWKGIFQLNIALYTDYLHPVNLGNKEQEPKFGAFYSLQLNNYFVNLFPIKQTEPLKSLGQATIPVFNRKASAHIEIRANKSKKLIALLVDGLLVKQWTDTDEFSGEGRGMRFVYQGQAQGAIRLSNLWITEWDGQFEEQATNPADSKHDLTKLRNGDKVAGTLESIRDGKIAVDVSGKKLDIPLERVKQIELVQSTPRPAPGPSNVRAFFARGGSIAFLLERWDDQTVEAQVPNIGKLSFNPAAFVRLDFDLNRKNPEQAKVNFFF